MNLTIGQYVVAYGYKVKNDNDIYIVKNVYESDRGYCLYKVKLNGEPVKSKYRILFLNNKDFNNPDLTIRVLSGIEELKTAKQEVNIYIKKVESAEIVVTHSESNKTDLTNKCTIQVVKSIPTTKSIYNMPRGFYKVELLSNDRVMMRKLGKKGQVLSSLTGTYNLICFAMNTVKQFINEGYMIIVDEHKTTKGE